MADWSTYVIAALTGGTGTALVTFGKSLPEWWRHRRQDREAEERAEIEQPLRAKEQVVVAADQALVIHQRSIDALEQQVEDLQLRYRLQKEESDAEIQKLKDKNRELNAEVARLNGLTAQLYQTMGQMATELRGYRAASGQ